MTNAPVVANRDALSHAILAAMVGSRHPHETAERLIESGAVTTLAAALRDLAEDIPSMAVLSTFVNNGDGVDAALRTLADYLDSAPTDAEGA